MKRRFPYLALAGLTLASLPAAADTTTGTRSSLSATTMSLRTGTEFYDVGKSATPTTLPVTSVVMGETSQSAERVTSPPPRLEATTAPQSAQADLSTTEVLPEASTEQTVRLPVKVDDSSTASLEQQIQRFERRNQIGEAFLLARELVRQNPGAEYALNAAVRTSLVLGLEGDTEALYREAIRTSRLPGKYFVQLAHFYARTGRTEKAAALVAEYEKGNTKDPDYWMTLARLAVVAEDFDRAQAVLEKAAAAKVQVFPIISLTARIYRARALPDRARQVLLDAVDMDFGPWEKRAFFIEFLKLPGNKPSEIGRMVRATLVNESDYQKARGMADIILDRAIEERIFRALQVWLMQQVNQNTATDIEYWLAALMDEREGNTTGALEILTNPAAGTTPVIAYERARALAAANRSAEAIPILNILLAEQPTEPSIRLALAGQLLNSGRADAAADVLGTLQPSLLSASDRQRLCELALGAAVQSGEAPRVLDTWIDLAEAASFQDLQTMGDIVLRSLTDPRLAESLVALVDQRVARPGDWPLLLLRARIAAAQGRHQEELGFYGRYLENDWDNVQMLRFVAELCSQYASQPLTIEPEGKSSPVSVRAVDFSGTDLAIRLYRRLIELQPMLPDNYSALMRILQLRGEVETAKKVAIELADRKTSSGEVQLMAASILDDNGFAADALHFFERSLQLDPDNYEAWMKYADALRASRTFDKSEAICRRMMEQGLHGKPYNQPRLFATLLRIARESGTLPQQLDYLDGLRDRDLPGKAEFFLSASKLFIQVKAEDRAEKFLVRFQEKMPTSPLIPDSYLLLGQLRFNRQDTAGAIAAFRSVVDKFPGTQAEITARFNIGEAYRQMGEPQDAVTAWLELANKRPDDDKALAGMYEAAVTAHRELKDNELSKRLFRLYTESGVQDFALLRRARANLERLEMGQPLTDEESGS